MRPQENKKLKHDKGRSMKGTRTGILLVLFCLCIAGIAMVSAKYIKKDQTVNGATAKEFYFTSDLLDGNEHIVVPTETDATGTGGKTASVTIQLRNYADELRYSDTAIEYELSVKETNSENDADGVTIQYPSDTGSDGKHTLVDGSRNSADITISGLQEGKSYVVEATTSNTYQKTLTGTIKVAQSDTQVNASLKDASQYIEVTVWTTDYAGDVTLKYCQGLLPDNTDAEMRNAKTADSSTQQGSITESGWSVNTSHVFRFFKEDSTKTYQVTVNGEGVTVSE